MEQIASLLTEQRNPATVNIDQVSTLEMVQIMNREDQKTAEAVAETLPAVAQAIDLIAGHMRRGGRLVYCGSGTSGRLGVLDASECPPTFGVDPGLVTGLIAGGPAALTTAMEGVEDRPEEGKRDLVSIGFCREDVLVGIAASGRTPYVLGAMDYARSLGAEVLALTCCPDSAVARLAHISIAPQPGPEVIAGSTRLKSGTVQKMVLNMLSTGVMIRLGKVYSNLMVDVQATNEKLRARALSIVRTATGAGEEQASSALAQAEWSVKTAIVMILCRVGAAEANQLLTDNEGQIARVVPAGDKAERSEQSLRPDSSSDSEGSHG